MIYNCRMITIATIQPDQVEEARRLLHATAFTIFQDASTLEEAYAYYAEHWPLRDLDDGCRHYFENDGVFYVMMETAEGEARGRIIGTGALRRLEEGVCELKRLWFAPEYQGKGLGYQMMTRLLAVAREKGYQKMRLCTSPLYQAKAVSFYKRLGFYEIPLYGDDEEDISMELVL